MAKGTENNNVRQLKRLYTKHLNASDLIDRKGLFNLLQSVIGIILFGITDLVIASLLSFLKMFSNYLS